MRSIKLIETTVTSSQVPDGFKLNYKMELLRMCELIPEGISFAQMNSGLRVVAKLNEGKVGDTIYLEDADYLWLKGRAEKQTYTLLCPEIMEMLRAVIEAEECAVAKAVVGAGD